MLSDPLIDLPNKLTVGIDTREHKEIVFPANVRIWKGNCLTPLSRDRGRLIQVTTERIKLDAGDYVVRDFEDITRAERKGSIHELAVNVCEQNDRKRFSRQLEKLMSACRYPILYLDFLLSSCRAKAQVYEHEQVLSRLFNTLALTNIAVVWGGRCRATGDTLLRLLLSRILYGRRHD